MRLALYWIRPTIALGMFGNPIMTTILEGALREPNPLTPIRVGGSCLFVNWNQFHIMELGFIWREKIAELFQSYAIQ